MRINIFLIILLNSTTNLLSANASNKPKGN